MLNEKSPIFTDKDRIESISKAFRHPQLFKDESVRYEPDGFPVAFIPEPFDSDFLVKVRQHLLEQEFHEKHNDLYRFMQSKDLTRITTEKNSPIGQLHDLLVSERFINWLKQVSGIELISGRIDMAGQRYGYTHHLLCHDDDIEEGEYVRKIAFIIYLVTPPPMAQDRSQWAEEDGGKLEVFALNPADNLPSDVVMSIVPQWNSLAFFEVTPTSYHQVSEVLAKSKERVSLTGWFYGPPTPAEKLSLLPKYPDNLSLRNPKEFVVTGENMLGTLINPAYLARPAKRKMQKRFIQESVLELQDFLKPEAFERISGSILSSGSTLRGPANCCRYLRLLDLPELTSLLKSAEFRDFLQQITNLELTAIIQSEARQFKKKGYTLLNDKCLEPPGLDVVLHLNQGKTKKSWPSSAGGQMVYLDDEDTLLTVVPKRNALSIVYRTSGVNRFVEYVNNKAPEARVDFSTIYQVNDDESESERNEKVGK